MTMIHENDRKKWISSIDDSIGKFPSRVISTIIVDYLVNDPHFDTNVKKCDCKWSCAHSDIVNILDHLTIMHKTICAVNYTHPWLYIPLQMNMTHSFKLAFDIIGSIKLCLNYTTDQHQGRSCYCGRFITANNLRFTDVDIIGQERQIAVVIYTTFEAFEELSIIILRSYFNQKHLETTYVNTFRLPMGTVSNLHISFAVGCPNTRVDILSLENDLQFWTHMNDIIAKSDRQCPLDIPPLL
jgi:hypothetical protein